MISFLFKPSFAGSPSSLSTHPLKIQTAPAIFLSLLLLIVCNPSAHAQSAQTDWGALLQSPLRLEKDIKQDSTRSPVELLQFTQVRAGWRVMDIYSGGGYTAQLMALAVTPSGKVYAQMDKPSKAFEERLSLHPQANIEFIQRPMEELLPSGTTKLDLITLIYSYHDIAYMPLDRLKMDKVIYDSLREGGVFVIIDHSAKEGSGLEDTKTLHRIDKNLVIQDFLSVGFKLDQEGDFLKNPLDLRDQVSTKTTPHADGFVLRFKK